MADVRIQDLITATVAGDNDLFIVEDNADTKKITKTNLVETLGINARAPLVHNHDDRYFTKAETQMTFGRTSFSGGAATVETGLTSGSLIGLNYLITVIGNPNINGSPLYRGTVGGFLTITGVFASGQIQFRANYTQLFVNTGGADGLNFGITPSFAGTNPTPSQTATLRIVVTGFNFDPTSQFRLVLREVGALLV